MYNDGEGFIIRCLTRSIKWIQKNFFYYLTWRNIITTIFTTCFISIYIIWKVDKISCLPPSCLSLQFFSTRVSSRCVLSQNLAAEPVCSIVGAQSRKARISSVICMYRTSSAETLGIFPSYFRRRLFWRC